MAEIEYFVDPTDKKHPKFKNYKYKIYELIIEIFNYLYLID